MSVSDADIVRVWNRARTSREVATALGMNASAVRSRISRIRHAHPDWKVREPARRYDVGTLLRVGREIAGISQRELARRSGLSRKLIWNIETGHTHPTRDQIRAWELALLPEERRATAQLVALESP